jgi:hypothetical protein
MPVPDLLTFKIEGVAYLPAVIIATPFFEAVVQHMLIQDIPAKPLAVLDTEWDIITLWSVCPRKMWIENANLSTAGSLVQIIDRSSTEDGGVKR